MPGTRIRCHYLDCEFLDDGYCSAAAIEIDPDKGCITYTQIAEELPEDEWEDEDVDMEEWDELEEEDGDEDLWLDENEDY